jgi:membrane-associated protease RseP (regulator of RpoE activity)
VFLFEPAETPYDLRFRLLGVNVRVHPFFWLFTALFGWSWYQAGGGNLGFLLLWVVAAFVSILVHEFGHVLVGRAFGSHGYVVLYSFGGLAVGSSNLARRWQRVLVLLAGPGAQFLLLGLVLLGNLAWEVSQSRPAPRRSPPPAAVAPAEPGDRGDAADASADQAEDPLPAARPARAQLPYLRVFVLQMVFINLVWPILNLLPVFPLDGGQVSLEVCQGVSPQGGRGFAFGLSMVVAGVLALHFFLGEKSPLIRYIPVTGMYAGIFFALLAVSSFQALQADTARRRQYSDDQLPWER